MSQRPALPYHVECSYGTLRFEPIAAFNVDRVALVYAVTCAASRALNGYQYRVVERDGGRPRTLHDHAAIAKLIGDPDYQFKERKPAYDEQAKVTPDGGTGAV